MSIFWNFFDSCAKKNKKITKLFLCFTDKKWEHNAHKKNAPKKPHFFGRKNWHVILMDAIFCFIWSKFDKTLANYLATNDGTQSMCCHHIWCHGTSNFKKCLFCFIWVKKNKTNRWPYHKRFHTCLHFTRHMMWIVNIKKRFKTLDKKWPLP